MTARILVVDDQEPNRRLLTDLLGHHGYLTTEAHDGESALRLLDSVAPDLVLLDVVMPGIDGFSVLRSIRADSSKSHLPVVLCTALDPDRERNRGIELGADDFLQKPINAAELLARVRSLLRVKQLFDTVTEREGELREVNATLERRVTEKVEEIERLNRLRRFFSGALADRILSGGVTDPLTSHRRDIAVVFVDLRGFTAFSDTAAPEDVMRVLRQFHEALGLCIDTSGGTIERFTGDGVMVFFNDPELVDNPCGRAIVFARSVNAAVTQLSAVWAAEGFLLSAGLGVAYGYATLGAIGYRGRIDYGAIGSVTGSPRFQCNK